MAEDWRVPNLTPIALKGSRGDPGNCHSESLLIRRSL